ncbi:hypothetical protein WOLCODRAFT_166912 [Wolfiporia cocos MD-104 SS10]|uniref:DNAJ-containing protein X-domain domain-containing protein n=1 Tax=Wolfiporia cocos (strain MD-104) TaxID=742152 RepID=A0A2H3J2G7_WOLCO|nr:hypothetical protein WOLCODRAFT_166912 [Wolfiporia cocos MD-104 SS10]
MQARQTTNDGNITTCVRPASRVQTSSRAQIGEISLMKEMTSVATTMMTEEEKAEIEREMNDGPASPTAGTPPVLAVTPTGEPPAQPQPRVATNGAALGAGAGSPAGSPAPSPSDTPPARGAMSPPPPRERERERRDTHAKKREKMTQEQKKKLQELEEERRRNMEERVRALTEKLKDRLRPFVEAKHPGDREDPETVAFEAKMRREADDLKLESFGVELLHTIGNVYIMKATSYLKSKKFLGIPGFFSRLKEKGAVAKDAWGVIGSALGVQQVIQEMEKLQAKGEVPEDELRALEEDVTGKIMLASWRGTRFEVVQVLREVVDNVLKDPEASDQVLYNRAKGMVAEAASGKSKHHHVRTSRAKQKQGEAGAPVAGSKDEKKGHTPQHSAS